MDLDHTLTALADPTRRAILAHLARGEARVTEIAAPFAISLNSVSKHIRILERAGLVHRRIAGREHFLAYDPRPLDAATEWLERHRRFWSQRLDALEAALHAEDAVARARAKPNARSKR
jgi:DNA-binding transcriptional ArsR family regulator